MAGILLGALVGGASTVGTVQMAYKFGFSAIWFTAGAGLGCLLLGIRFAEPVRESGITTISDYLEQSYSRGGSKFGRRLSRVATVSSSAGTFISMGAQLISCAALLQGALPMPLFAATALSAFCVFGFIAAGGLKSFSKLGEAKIILLYGVLIICVITAVKNGGGFSSVGSYLAKAHGAAFFGRPLEKDLGAICAMVVGVFSTQIYVQSLVAARDTKTARTGAFISAALVPPMGLMGTWIGLSVRAKGVVIPAGQVLPWFIKESFPGLAGGIIWSGIFITAVACAAGLALGITTNISKNLIPEKFFERFKTRPLAVERSLIFMLVAAALTLSVFGADSMILEWSYLSMGLRGAGIFVPFTLAVVYPGRLKPFWAFASSVGGLAAMAAWALAGLPFDPVFAGIALSALLALFGMRKN